jgi:hypothetical protein
MVYKDWFNHNANQEQIKQMKDKDSDIVIGKRVRHK